MPDLIAGLSGATRDGVLRTVRRVIAEALEQGWLPTRRARTAAGDRADAQGADAVGAFALKLGASEAGGRLSDEAFFARSAGMRRR